MATDWHAQAHCINSACEWREDQRGESKVAQPVDLAARKHMDANAGHATSNGVHRAVYCGELGCPPAGTD